MVILLGSLVFVVAVWCRIQLLAMNILTRISLLQSNLFDQR